jgi:CBS domain containing-hemolysin-like protein
MLALGVSALCSVLEATLLSLTPSQVATLTDRHPRRGAIWQAFKSRIDRPIAAILILNTAAHTIGATMAGASFEALYGPESIIWFSLVFTFLMLQFTEILPKTLGVRFNQRLARFIAFPLNYLVTALRPVLYLVHLLNRPFEPRGPQKKAVATLEEISALAGLARLRNLISPHQEKIIRETSRLSRKTARDLMIPRDEVVFLRADQPLEEALQAGAEHLHTRYPVLDRHQSTRVIGYVNFKEIVHLAHAAVENGSKGPSLERSVERIVRPVYFAAPDQPAAELLRVFIERRAHMAIVRDETDRALGMITLEDVMEELVGELEDEFDADGQNSPGSGDTTRPA